MRPLFGDQTRRSVETMAFSGKTLGQYPDYVKNLLLVKIAAAKANSAAGAISPENEAKIVAACRQAIASFDHSQYPVDVCHGGGGTGINMNINEVVAALSSLDKSVVNASQSSSDVCHTAGRLTLVERLDVLDRVLTACIGVFDHHARDFSEVQTIARTCLRDAMPMSMGRRFSAFRDVIARRAKALRRLRETMTEINIGGTVIGNGAGAPEKYRQGVVACLEEMCGLKLSCATNCYDAAQNIDELVDLSHELANLAGALQKICQDLRFLASGPKAGIGELSMPKTQDGSTFFPDKTNPVLAEMMIQGAMLVTSLATSVAACQSHGEADVNVYEPFAAILVMDQIRMLSAAVESATKHAFSGITVDRERCRILAATHSART